MSSSSTVAAFAGGVIVGVAVTTGITAAVWAASSASSKNVVVSVPRNDSAPPSLVGVGSGGSSSSSNSSSSSSSGSSNSGTSSAVSSNTSRPSNKKPIRVYIDGVFDLMHYGHSNALRQAAAEGDELIVGLVNDAEVVKNKGSPPVMPEVERYEALRACKWVGEVIRDAPYDLTEEWVKELIDKHRVDYMVHGDDPCITADGKDAYAYAKKIGRYREFKRTEGVSTTDIVGRMLCMTREHHAAPLSTSDDMDVTGVSSSHSNSDNNSSSSSSSSSFSSSSSSSGAASGTPGTPSGRVGHLRSSSISLEAVDAADAAAAGGFKAPSSASSTSSSSSTQGESAVSTIGSASGPQATSSNPATGSSSSPTPTAAPTSSSLGALSFNSKFLPTARRIAQFMGKGKVPGPDDTVVYMCGSFDLFNAGHIAALEEAKKLGTFLLVGIHTDATINAMRGHGLPVLNLYERALSLLSCKHVNEVIIGAPWEITDEMIKSMNIKVVARGTVSDMQDEAGYTRMGWGFDQGKFEEKRAGEYAVPERLGILRTINSPRALTSLEIIDRIFSNHSMFAARYARKSKMEEAYVANKSYVVEA